MMKLSCLPVSIFGDIISGKMNLEDWIKGASDIGYDALDVSVLFFPDRTRRLLQAAGNALARNNMTIAMMTTYPDFTNPDKT